ncbi:ABC transporter substrate-binding protein [Corynebacterium aurimucosum]|uniref:Putative secreted protein n=1 Tax=Corynebacterium aurimucosum (strain ATCC 700975 / DSM 44827 / CIP 107346 / CN-1) TaxID=548476 RepID=C3PGL8_CORA7|nr:ABC transporter substrate-binding protein [Corynebacterium aurimucosum]ACP32972.1 putative secreted protein [Corynebacterium aurimucosum ATCC 700975]QQU92882.1 ABC transporter substrate-binding protein [Corynebacterium aurimucosum]
MIKKTAIVGVVGALASATLSGCVTNEEPALPEGWSEPKVDEVPEIAAMYEDADGVLTVGTNPPFAPFEFKDSDGSLIGLEMDLANAVAQVLGLEFQPVEQDFSMILPAVQSGQIDLGGSGFTDTDERRENFDFVDILYAGIQWAKLTDGPNEVDPSNPCGLTVAVQRTTVSETDDLRPKQEACDGDLTILPYDTSDNAALAVLMGRADALSADSPVSAWAVNRSDGRMSMVGEMFDAAPYGFAVPKDSDLGPAVAAALQHLIDTGAYAEILDKWGVTDGLVEHAMINERPIND